jgi:hypothetical protein
MAAKILNGLLRFVKEASLPEAIPSGHRGLRAGTDGWYDHDEGDADGKLLVSVNNLVNPNVIYNGNFDVWQEAIGIGVLSSTQYICDGFQWYQSSTAVVAAAQSTDVPDSKSRYSLRVDPSTADASIAAGDYAIISHAVEGYAARAFIDTGGTLSFWVRSHQTGIHCVAFRNSGADRTFVVEYTINAANTWEYKVVHFDPLPASGTWNYTNGIGVGISWALAAGASFQTTPNAWNTGNFMATANQVNAIGATGAGGFHLAQVKLEPGAVATPFVPGPLDETLRRCQRYFCKSYDSDVAPGTSVATATGRGFAASAGTVVSGQRFPVEMRTTPTTVLYAPDGTSGKVWDALVGNVGAGAITMTLNKSGISYFSFGSNGLTANREVLYNYTANARL